MGSLASFGQPSPASQLHRFPTVQRALDVEHGAGIRVAPHHDRGRHPQDEIHRPRQAPVGAGGDVDRWKPKRRINTSALSPSSSSGARFRSNWRSTRLRKVLSTQRAWMRPRSSGAPGRFELSRRDVDQRVGQLVMRLLGEDVVELARCQPAQDGFDERGGGRDLFGSLVQAALSAGSASGCSPAGRLNSFRAGCPGGDVTVASAPLARPGRSLVPGASQRPSGWSRTSSPGPRRRR